MKNSLKQPLSEDARRVGLEPAQYIVYLANLKGRFEVSWRYRDDWLNSRCNALCKRKLLKRLRNSPPGKDIYLPRDSVQTFTFLTYLPKNLQRHLRKRIDKLECIPHSAFVAEAAAQRASTDD